MTALRDAAEQAESLACQAYERTDDYLMLAPLGGPDEWIAADVRRCARAAIGRLQDVLALLGTAPEG